VIHCRNCVGCSELTFAAETELSATNQFFAAELATCSEPVFGDELAACSEPVFADELAAYRQPASLPNWQPAANQFSLPISTIGLLG